VSFRGARAVRGSGLLIAAIAASLRAPVLRNRPAGPRSQIRRQLQGSAVGHHAGITQSRRAVQVCRPPVDPLRSLRRSCRFRLLSPASAISATSAVPPLLFPVTVSPSAVSAPPSLHASVVRRPSTRLLTLSFHARPYQPHDCHTRRLCSSDPPRGTVSVVQLSFASTRATSTTCPT